MFQSYSLPVQFRDIDDFGHVGHTNVIAFCQEARLAMFREMSLYTGRDLGAEGGFVVVRIEAEYLRPILYSDQRVQIHDDIVAVGTRSFGVHHRVHVEDEIAANVRATLVLVNDDASSRSLTAMEREWLQERVVSEAV